MLLFIFEIIFQLHKVLVLHEKNAQVKVITFRKTYRECNLAENVLIVSLKRNTTIYEYENHMHVLIRISCISLEKVFTHTYLFIIIFPKIDKLLTIQNSYNTSIIFL